MGDVFFPQVNDYVFARQTEKKELMKDISKEMSSEKPSGVPGNIQIFFCLSR